MILHPSPHVRAALDRIARENSWTRAEVAAEVLRSWAEGLDELPENTIDSSPERDTIRRGSKSRKGGTK
jgi:hypothetical protein